MFLSISNNLSISLALTPGLIQISLFFISMISSNKDKWFLKYEYRFLTVVPAVPHISVIVRVVPKYVFSNCNIWGRLAILIAFSLGYFLTQIVDVVYSSFDGIWSTIVHRIYTKSKFVKCQFFYFQVFEHFQTGSVWKERASYFIIL